MRAFWTEKEMIIFFVSMAYHFSEQASHLVSRESVAALIPGEKPATLPESLSQNAPGSARICVGLDNHLVFCVIERCQADSAYRLHRIRDGIVEEGNMLTCV